MSNPDDALAAVEYAARRARLTPDQARTLRSLAASYAAHGHRLTADELAAGAELLAGRIDFAGYRRWLHV